MVCLLVGSAVAAIVEPVLADSGASTSIGFTLYPPTLAVPSGHAAIAVKNSTTLAWYIEVNESIRPVGGASLVYTALMLVNGSTYGLGNLTLSSKGTSEASGYLRLHPGTYALGIEVVQGQVLALKGLPYPQYLTLGENVIGTTSSTTSKSTTSTITTSTTTIRNNSTTTESTKSTSTESTSVNVTPPKTTSTESHSTVSTSTVTSIRSVPFTTVTEVTTTATTVVNTVSTVTATTTTEVTATATASETVTVVPPITEATSGVRFAFYRPGETNSSFGAGEVGVTSSNSSRLVFYVEVTGLAQPTSSISASAAQYTVEITVNGTTYSAGALAVTSAGRGTASGYLTLPHRNYHRYVVGIEILSGSTLVLVGEPTPQVIVLGSGIPPAPTALGNYLLGNAADKFVLYAPGENTTVNGLAGVGAYNSTTILVSVGVYSINHLSSSLEYNVVVTLNGTAHDVASLHVNSEGGGSAFGSLKATPGVYKVGIQVLSGTSVLLIGEPSPQILRLGASVNPGGVPPVPIINAVRFSLDQPGGSVAQGVAYVGAPGDDSAELKYEVLVYSSAGLSPSAKFGVVLSVNGTTYTAGTLTASSENTWTASGSVMLPPGHYRTYIVGIEILAGTSVVLVGEPTPQTLVFNPHAVGGAPPKTYYFSFVSVDGSGVKGKAAVVPQGTSLRVYATFGNLTVNAQYTLELIANGTVHKVGSLVFGDVANVQMQTVVPLSPGTWQVGFALAANGITVLQSDPVAATIVLGPTPIVSPAGVTSPTVIGSNQTVVQSIQQAQNDGTIPVVVQVSGNGTTASLLSPQFSVSLGQETNGVLVTISGTNVHGSRILLVNFDQPIDQSKALSVTLDNQTVTEASSLTQLFGSPTVPLFVVVSTSSGTQLLISIPHFSTHVIQISEVPAIIALAFAADARVLLAAVLVTTIVFAAVYARREKFFVVL